jgi:hypothetical protein
MQISSEKMHKLSFRDKNKDTSVSDVYHVESYKAYNAVEVENDSLVCNCSIF